MTFPFLYLLTALSVTSICLAVTYGRPFRWLRLYAAWTPVGGLLYCPWCLSYWVAGPFAFLLGYEVGQGPAGFLILWLSLVATSSICMIPLLYLIKRIEERTHD